MPGVKGSIPQSVTRTRSERPAAARTVEDSRKGADLQLSDSQRLAQIGSWHWESGTNQLVWSRELFYLLGLSPQKDKPSVELFLSRLEPADRRLATQLLARPDLVKLRDRVEARLLPVKGRSRTVELRVEVVAGSEGAGSRLVGTALDITDRKRVEQELRISRDKLEITNNRRSVELVQANQRLISELADRKSTEEALRRSEERFRKIFEEAPIGMVLGGQDFRILRVNNAFCRMIDYTEKDLLGRTLAELTHPDDLEKEISWTAEFFRQGMPNFQNEKRFCTRQGKVLWIRMTVSVVRDNAGRISYAIAMVENVTERKTSEEQLRKSREELRALTGHLQWVREKERSRISREIHDELGQALTGLKMDLAWLENRLGKGKRSTALPASNAVYQRLNSMSDVIDGTIRQVRRITTELRPRVLDELGLVAAIEWQAHEFQTRTGTRCRFYCRQESVGMPTEEATTMFRILQETLTNVTRHARATCVEIRLEEVGETLQLEVRDNGRGIPSDKITAAQSLGLVGMRERALLSRGQLDIKGTKGQGTVVTLTMPRWKKAARRSASGRGKKNS